MSDEDFEQLVREFDTDYIDAQAQAESVQKTAGQVVEKITETIPEQVVEKFTETIVEQVEEAKETVTTTVASSGFLTPENLFYFLIIVIAGKRYWKITFDNCHSQDQNRDQVIDHVYRVQCLRIHIQTSWFYLKLLIIHMRV